VRIGINPRLARWYERLARQPRRGGPRAGSPDGLGAAGRPDGTRGTRALVDLHCHTDASFDSLAAPASVVRAATSRGLTHLAITDHDRVDGALRARDAAPAGLSVIVGEEIRTQEGDIICVFLERPILSGAPVLETIAAARDQGALVGIPHPFDRSRASLLVDPHLEYLADRVDWVETWNARVVDGEVNARAAAFARARGLPDIAVSDAHSILEVGLAYSILYGDLSTPTGLRDALKSASHGFGHPSDR
jgi:predicted metal-dependent phosphoesterase TrpH